MGSRKDFIKRSLGISDYPWSSDDDLETLAVAAQEATLHRPSSESRPEPEAPGTSGISSQQSMQQQQQPLHQQHQLHQHQQQQQHQPQQQQPPQQQQQQQHPEEQLQPELNSPPRRNQARTDREIFWSILNTPPHQILPNHLRMRAGEIPMSYLSRVNHVPASELRRRSGERPDIQRILAFKRLTRNMGPLRHGGTIAGVIPVTRVNPGVIVPSEANSTIRISRHYPYRRVVRNESARSNSLRTGYQTPYVELTVGGGAGRRGGRGSPNGEEELPQQPPAHRQAAQNEVNNNPIPPDGDSAILDEGNVEQDEPLLGDLETEANNNSGPNLSLEEDIAIELDNSDVQGTADEDVVRDMVRDVRDAIRDSHAPSVDVRDSPAPSATRIATEYHRPSDANMPSTSDAPPDSGHNQNGVMRKSRGSEAEVNAEPKSVKEFNQSLLRLLECPVCLEWMEPPMSQCRRGHLVCSRCRARLASCPVCRTTFSSVRNRAMEGVAEMLRYPCRHGCGREVRLRRRAPHEASCAARTYQCPAPACAGATPLPHAQLAVHFRSSQQSPGGNSPEPVLSGRGQPDMDGGGQPVGSESDQPVVGGGGQYPPAQDEEILLEADNSPPTVDLLDLGIVEPPNWPFGHGISYLATIGRIARNIANQSSLLRQNHPQRDGEQPIMSPQNNGGQAPLPHQVGDLLAPPFVHPVDPNLSYDIFQDILEYMQRQSRHMSMVKIGRSHRFAMKVNSEQHENWLILALEQYFHLRIDVNMHTWGVVIYVSYIGPKCDAKNFFYEVTIDGQQNKRKLVYGRTTHSDIECSSLNGGHQDSFHLTVDQAHNFIRFKNHACNTEKYLEINVVISKVGPLTAAPQNLDS